jgi:hypothetical protein
MTTKSKKSRNSALGQSLRRQGFDLTRFDRSEGYFRVGCSQCDALVIQGVACHETGCPNAPRSSERHVPGLGWFSEEEEPGDE